MKNRLVLSAVLSLLYLSMSAQVWGGIELGINLHTQVNPLADSLAETGTTYSWESGFHFALPLEFTLSDRSRFHSGIQIVQRGLVLSKDLSNPPLSHEITEKYTFTYFEFPLIYKQTLPVLKESVFFSIGPSFGFASSGNLERTERIAFGSNETLTETITDLDLSASDFRRTDLGLNIGVGMQYDLGGIEAFTAANYYHGILNRYKGDTPNITERNRSLDLRIGILFPIGGNAAGLDTNRLSAKEYLEAQVGDETRLLVYKGRFAFGTMPSKRIDSPNAGKIYTFWGAFRPEFLDIMKARPLAYRELVKAEKYSRLQLASTAGMVIMSGLGLRESLINRGLLERGKFPNTPSVGSFIAMDFVFFGTLVYSIVKANRHIDQAVRIYNDGLSPLNYY